MSLIYNYNEYIISNNNSINENKYNDDKVTKSASYKIKKILKPFMRILNRKSSRRSAKLQKSYDEEFNSCGEDFWSSEIDENSANEELESRIFREIENCPEQAAVYVYDGEECERQLVTREQKFVPVHFARTEAGTFFWTTLTSRPADEDLIQPTFCCSNFQRAETQYGSDRWVQA